jgi:magnesium-transporting ATPase (P-type)
MAVAAIPEGLPAVMTITLALGVQRMAKRNAIIRRLPAVESLGAVTVICTDKTGTLTRNEMTVERFFTADQVFDVSGTGYAPHGGCSCEGKEVAVVEHAVALQLVRVGLLCNDASLHQESIDWHISGDPTEGALITLAVKAGLDGTFEHAELPRTDLIPFEAEHRFMATLHHDNAGHGFIYVKGAVEQVLAMCGQQRSVEGDRPLDLESWHRKMKEIGASGQRVLGLAMRDVDAGKRELNFEDMQEGFTFLGMVGIADPLREEALVAVRECKAAGIKVKMITGDHAETARAIAAKLGMGAGRVLTGSEIDSLDESELREAVKVVEVFARASPEHKLRLVSALQANGEIVAMTGDGVNDAPALKLADIGVAMGMKGTEVAKEAAEMVLADDNFATITHAVAEGRAIYDNLKKAIVFIIPTNGGEAGMVLVAILFGLTLPITPVQILWVNMISAVTLGMALSFEKMESGVMLRSPRSSAEPILSGFMLWRIGFVSVLLTAGPFLLFMWEYSRGLSLEESRTVAVNALVMGEIFYLFNCRYIFASALSREGFFGNRIVLLSIAVLMVMQLAFTYLPAMQQLFSTVDIDASAWLRIICFGLMLFGIVELEKYVLRTSRG